MAIQVPPLREHFATDEEWQAELDVFTTEVARQINAGEISGTGGEGDVSTDTTTGEVTSADGMLLFYLYRYLHIAYGSSNTGADFNSGAYNGEAFYGIRNSDTVTESTNPAQYTWNAIDSPSSSIIPSFRIVGGRRIDLSFVTTTPTDYQPIPEISIDLDDFAEGQTGAPGEAATFVNVEIKMPGGVGSDPTGWLDETNTYKNNTGADKALVAIVVRGDTEDSLAAHNTYSYTWRKNGVLLSPNATQRSDTGPLERVVIINAEDIEDNGDDAFTVEIDIP